VYVRSSQEDSAGRTGASPHPGEYEEDLRGESRAFLDFVGELRRFALSTARTILLTGESGTGKSLAARVIHRMRGPTGDPLLTIQCCAIPSPLLEEELLGGGRGEGAAGSDRGGMLRLAGRGTVLLDDIDRLPVAIQWRIAQLLAGGAQRPIECTLIGASRLAPGAPGWERLIPELRAHLEPPRIDLPPLRRREGDVECLTSHFLRRWAMERNRSVPRLDGATLDALDRYPWPGNIRELRCTLERAAERGSGREIQLDQLWVQRRANHSMEVGEQEASDLIFIPPGGKPWERIEEEVVQATLHLTNGNRSAAARMLGISRPTLTRKIRKYGVVFPSHPI